MKRNLRNVIFIVALMALIGAAVADGQLMDLAGKRKSAHPMTAQVDSVMVRSDVSRVYCRVIGRPHTSQCIDSVYITLPDGTNMGATDIDPIYFKRSFQWEDEPDMPLEIDFAPTGKSLNKFKLTMITPYGNVSTTWSRSK